MEPLVDVESRLLSQLFFHCANCGLTCTDEKSLVNHAFSSMCGEQENNAPVTSINGKLPSSEHEQSVVVFKVLQPFKIITTQPCDFDELHVLSTVTANAGMGYSTSVSLNQESLPSFESSVKYPVSGVKQTESPYFEDTQCSICTEIADSAKSLKSHLIAHHGFDGCSICDFASRSTDLEDHMKIAHASDSDILQNVEEEIESVQPSKRKKQIPINCRICGIRCCNMTRYRMHFIKFHADLRLDDMFANGWKCGHCFNVFPSLKSLQKHWILQHNKSYSKEMFQNFAQQARSGIIPDLAFFPSEVKSFNSESTILDKSGSICHIRKQQCRNEDQMANSTNLVHDVTVNHNKL